MLHFLKSYQAYSNLRTFERPQGMRTMALPQEPAVKAETLQQGSGEQGADNQVSEMMEKFPRKICCHIVIP